MKRGPCLRSFRLANFKAVHKSNTVAFTPLTVLIGNNGSGKSSLIEGLETYRAIVSEGLDTAMQRWYGMDHVINQRVAHQTRGLGLAGPRYTNPIEFTLNLAADGQAWRCEMTVNFGPGKNSYLIEKETVKCAGTPAVSRGHDGTCIVSPLSKIKGRAALPKTSAQPGLSSGQIHETAAATDDWFARRLATGESCLPPQVRACIRRWQFLSLAPEPMGRPSPRQMALGQRVLLNRDGSNIAQYLLDIRDKDTAAFEGIVESMQFVLGFARNIQPEQTREIQPTLFLKLMEQFEEKTIAIPGWLISSGTLRVLAILAVLRHPEPPPLVVVEEIENGLDPRTIHMVLDEIRMAVQSGRTQVILTTHSPYLLDLLPLPTLVLVERAEGGDPVFWRPADSEQVQQWAKAFAPGQLYTSGRFRREVGP